MSNALIAPIYNEVRNIKGLLNDVFASDIAFNFLLGLAGPQDGPLLESWLQDPVNLSGFNQIVLDADSVAQLVTLAGPMGAIANSDTASNSALNNTAFVNAIANSQAATLAVFSSTTALDYLVSGAVAAPLFINNATTMGWVVNDSSAMSSLSVKSSVMDVVFSYTTSRTLIFASPHILEAWKVYDFVDRFVAYLGTLTTEQSEILTYGGKVGLPIDGSLVSDAVLQGKVDLTNSSYDQQRAVFIPSGNILLDNIDAVTWMPGSSSAIEPSDNMLTLHQEAYYSAYNTLIFEVDSDSPVSGGYAIKVTGNGVSGGYFYGLAFTQRTVS